MLNLIKKIFGTQQTRVIRRYQKMVKSINEIESNLQSLSDEQLQNKTSLFRKRLENGETTDDILLEAYAVVKNTCRRLCGKEVHVSGYNQKWDMIPYDVQIVGALAMHFRSISEMQTGEGKTLTASMPLYLHALTGKPTHLVTVNDYLAQRDCEWVGAIFRFLGLTVESLTNETPIEKRKSVYAADIVYGTASEFGFDYLRDNSMAQSKNEVVQRGHYFALIDEIDSILIDEARTPLIISGPVASSNQMYHALKTPVGDLVKLQRDFCNKLATEAKRVLDKHKLLEESASERKLTKAEKEEIDQALRNLWIVSKGTPTHKVIKRVKEHPDLRKQLEDIETYFYAEPNKQEKSEHLSQLYIIIDERSSDYELTDKGIHEWATIDAANTEDDFTMLDLGYEYAQIDHQTSLSEDERLQKKIALREEDSRRKERVHNLRQLFRAHLLMEKDVDYIVQEGKIVIIDENTGRPQPGRRFSDGLHQAIEAKENVAIQQETQTYATITLQNYFRLYDCLCGMTGTAMTEANEFKQIYDLKVVAIPSNKTCQRKDSDDEIYMTEREKYQAILKDILAVHAAGRPILLGTESVEASEKVSRILRQNKLDHTVLNAKNHAKEAEIIAMAGQPGSITVSTNMAGRGTDIKLGEGVAALGGLHVIGTTRHHSRRIDRQLRGRCARQGDPGSSKFYVSFEDSLMRLFTSPKLSIFLQKFRPPEGEPIAAPILNRSIETAQKRIEQRNFSMRKHTLEYDDVMNKQRQEVYNFRNEVLFHENPLKVACQVLEDVNSHLFQKSFDAEKRHLDLAGYLKEVSLHFPVSMDLTELEGKRLTSEEIETIAMNKISDIFKQKLEHEAKMIAALQQASGRNVEPLQVLYDVIRSLIIKTVDRNWQDHLLSIDHLRTEVGMRVVGQKDPLIEFKHEAFELFHDFSLLVKEQIAHALFRFEMMLPPSKQLHETIAQILSKETFHSFVQLD